MRQVTLSSEETQIVQIVLGGKSYQFRFYPFRTLMYMDAQLNKDYVFAGKRIMSNKWLLPHYVTPDGSNLRFETYKPDANSYVWYEGFNTKFRLVVYNADEVTEINGKT